MTKIAGKILAFIEPRLAVAAQFRGLVVLSILILLASTQLMADEAFLCDACGCDLWGPIHDGMWPRGCSSYGIFWAWESCGFHPGTNCYHVIIREP